MSDGGRKFKIAAVIFDLDGIIIDSEQAWDDARRRFTDEAGGRWRGGATRAMMGMSSHEWSSYMHTELGVPLEPDEINRRVLGIMEQIFLGQLPLIPGAVDVVRRMADHWPVALASSANRELIDFVLDRTKLDTVFRASVSSEEVGRGKPAPDVYLEAARRLDVPAERSVAVEDSANGIRSAKAAGMQVAAVPNRALPPGPEVLATADLVLDSITGLDPQKLEGMNRP